MAYAMLIALDHQTATGRPISFSNPPDNFHIFPSAISVEPI